MAEAVQKTKKKDDSVRLRAAAKAARKVQNAGGPEGKEALKSTPQKEKKDQHVSLFNDYHRQTAASSRGERNIAVLENEAMGKMPAQKNRALQAAHDVAPFSRSKQNLPEKGDYETNLSRQDMDAQELKLDLLGNLSRQNRYKMEREGLIDETQKGKSLSGIALMLNLTSDTADRHKKKPEIRDVIGQYMTAADSEQKQEQKPEEEEDVELKKAEKSPKEAEADPKLREQEIKAEDANVGFAPNRRNYTFMMKKYAEKLFQGAFLKEDSSLITEEERKKEDPAKRRKRAVFASIIKSMGIQVKYPESASDALYPDQETLLRHMTDR